MSGKNENYAGGYFNGCYVMSIPGNIATDAKEGALHTTRKSSKILLLLDRIL
jgi:hypothetical protein